MQGTDTNCGTIWAASVPPLPSRAHFPRCPVCPPVKRWKALQTQAFSLC